MDERTESNIVTTIKFRVNKYLKQLAESDLCLWTAVEIAGNYADSLCLSLVEQGQILKYEMKPFNKRESHWNPKFSVRILDEDWKWTTVGWELKWEESIWDDDEESIWDDEYALVGEDDK